MQRDAENYFSSRCLLISAVYNGVYLMTKTDIKCGLERFIYLIRYLLRTSKKLFENY